MTPTSPMHDCVYATAGWGVHDERWVAALLEVGLTPHIVSLGRDASDDLELRQAVAEAAAGGRPVLAGPLSAVTRPLASLPIRLVGLSWGYDLHNLEAEGADLTWLVRLDGLIVDSPTTRAIAETAGLPAERITFLPWGVDLRQFPFHAPWIDASRLRVPPHAHLVLSLRAHEAIYRVEDIIDAFARLEPRAGLREDRPDSYLIIAHSGSLTDHLKKRVSQLGIADRTRIIGLVPEYNLVPLLGRASCYVTASEVDGTSVTLLQAMACGTPVIASATPGNLAWIEDGSTGYTYPTGDVAALATLIDHVNHSYPTDLVERARARVERDADWHANLSRLRAALVF